MGKTLERLGLNPDNSIVIGSGILQALGIRKSRDIDLVVTQEIYTSLKKSGNFKIVESHSREILKDDLFEIGTDWNVLGKSYSFEDFDNNSIIIDGVRYITLDFLYRAKKSWLHQKNVRQKDIEDVRLIELYTTEIN